MSAAEPEKLLGEVEYNRCHDSFKRTVHVQKVGSFEIGMMLTYLLILLCLLLGSSDADSEFENILRVQMQALIYLIFQKYALRL